MDKANYPFEIYNSICGKKRFPQFRWRDDECGIYEPLGCQLSPQHLTEDLLKSSIKHGATLLDDFEVHQLRRHGDCFRIFCNKATITAKSLILAGGARLLPRLKDLGLHLFITIKKYNNTSSQQVKRSRFAA